MTVLSTSDDHAESIGHTAVVTVRVPNGADGELALEAERRVADVDGVTETAVEDLRGIEPRLSATVVTLAVTVRTEYRVADVELRERLSDGPGVEAVELADA